MDALGDKKEEPNATLVALVKTSQAPVPWSSEFEKMISGLRFTSSLSPEMQSHRLYIKRLLIDLNSELTGIADSATIASLQETRIAAANSMFGAFGKGVNVTAPFWCQWGCNVFLGDEVYINRDAQFHDDAPITIGSRTIIGPSVILCTSTHDLALDTPSASSPGDMARSKPYALPIIIEEEVWICARVTVNPGVKIGRGSVVASGSVVTRDVEAGVLVGGVPARVIRVLTEVDRKGSSGSGDV